MQDQMIDAIKCKQKRNHNTMTLLVNMNTWPYIFLMAPTNWFLAWIEIIVENTELYRIKEEM